MSKRNTIRVINQLVEKGELKRDSGGGPYGTNAYVVLAGMTKASRPILRCYLCGEPDPGDGTIEDHHPDPADLAFTIPLCRPCHIKVHKLLGSDNLSPTSPGGDKMSPLKNGGDAHVTPTSDMAAEGVTPGAKTGDRAVSPDPSLTTNSKPALEPSDMAIFANLWSQVLEDLALTMAKGTFDDLLRGSRLVEAVNGTWKVQVRHARAIPWLKNRISQGRSFQGIMAAHAPHVKSIEFIATEEK